MNFKSWIAFFFFPFSFGCVGDWCILVSIHACLNNPSNFETRRILSNFWLSFFLCEKIWWNHLSGCGIVAMVRKRWCWLIITIMLKFERLGLIFGLASLCVKKYAKILIVFVVWCISWLTSYHARNVGFWFYLPREIWILAIN